MDPGFDSPDLAVPAQLLVLAGGGPVRVVWRNGVGGVTCEFGQGDTRRFVKWAPAGGVDLAAEAARLDWAGQYVRVPVVVGGGSDSDGSWMITLPLPGENAVTTRWVADPAAATRAIGEGLRALHDTLPVSWCPFSWSAVDRVADAHRRAEAGQIDRREWDESHRPIDLSAALAIVRDIPGVDKLVVCHGDACSPNTLIDDRGHSSGHVDFGTMGVADRWADLAIATLATNGTMGRGGSSRRSTPTESPRIHSGPAITDCCGTSTRETALSVSSEGHRVAGRPVRYPSVGTPRREAAVTASDREPRWLGGSASVSRGIVMTNGNAALAGRRSP